MCNARVVLKNKICGSKEKIILRRIFNIIVRGDRWDNEFLNGHPEQF